MNCGACVPCLMRRDVNSFSCWAKVWAVLIVSSLSPTWVLGQDQVDADTEEAQKDASKTTPRDALKKGENRRKKRMPSPVKTGMSLRGNPKTQRAMLKRKAMNSLLSPTSARKRQAAKRRPLMNQRLRPRKSQPKRLTRLKRCPLVRPKRKPKNF